MDFPKLRLKRRIITRKSERRELSCDVSVGSESNFYLGVTENISEGGVFISSDSQIPLGTVVTLKFVLPSGTVSATGEVRWHRPQTSTQSSGVGVRFTNLSDEDKERVMAFLEKRQPIFHAE